MMKLRRLIPVYICECIPLNRNSFIFLLRRRLRNINSYLRRVFSYTEIYSPGEALSAPLTRKNGMQIDPGETKAYAAAPKK